MVVTTGTMWLFLILLLVPCIAGSAVQIYLSRRSAVWPGMILPLAGLVFSLLMCFRFSLFVKNGTAVLLAGTTGVYLMLLFLLNIPSAIFLGVYIMFRRRFERFVEPSELDDQDL